MTQAMVTFVAPLAIDKLAAAENAIDRLGNPASTAVRNALALQPDDENGTHFTSLHAIKSQYGDNAYIVFEFSTDGTEEAATARILATLGPMLRPVFMLSSDWSDGGDLGAFLKAHKVVTSNGLFGNPGVSFSGIPGFTVGRIDFEARLARFCATELESQDKDTPALARIAQVRAKVAADPDLNRALQPATIRATIQGRHFQ